MIWAASAVGARALLVIGWGGRTPTSSAARPRGREAATEDEVLAVGSIPNIGVLPLVDVVVHPGGAGSVHAVGRAFAVSVAVPFMADQPCWAKRPRPAGLSPRLPPARRLTSERLVQHLLQAPAHRLAARCGCAR